MKGRKMTPTAMKVLRGNPGKRALPKNEPQGRRRQRTPSAPSYLGEDAAAEWRRVARTLHEMRVLTEADLQALALYCAAFERWRAAEAEIEKEGLVVPTGTTGRGVKANPAVSISNMAWEQMRKILIEFGMTPSSRARVQALDGGEAEADPFDELLARRARRVGE